MMTSLAGAENTNSWEAVNKFQSKLTQNVEQITQLTTINLTVIVNAFLLLMTMCIMLLRISHVHVSLKVVGCKL